jgi:dipeptidyl-peptidase 4
LSDYGRAVLFQAASPEYFVSKCYSLTIAGTWSLAVADSPALHSRSREAALMYCLATTTPPQPTRFNPFHAAPNQVGRLLALPLFLPLTLILLSLCGSLTLEPSLARGQAAAVAERTSPAQNAGEPAGNEQLTRLLTVAESSGFTDTARTEEVELFLRILANEWEGVELTSLGNTTEGRTLWGLVVEPRVEVDYRPITVLILGGIHSGECDGKEAVLALARDMALEKLPANGWQSLRLVIVPNFNADGNARRGLLHRPGQAGPVAGMGIRENAQGLDLNRDFMKLESPEVRSLVAALNDYDVDVLIDTHTTNGSLHRYELTYDIPHNPATPASIQSYLRKKMMPEITAAMQRAGFSTFYYGNFNRDYSRWETYGHEPRYSTEYMGVRGRIGILAESYSYASYETRYQASYAFVAQVLEHLAADGPQVRSLIDDAAAEVGPGNKVPIGGEIVLAERDVTVKAYRGGEQELPRPPFGPEAAAKYRPHDYTVELWNQVSGTRSTVLPFAYALDPQYAWGVGRLLNHGIEVKRLLTPQRVKVEHYLTRSVQRQRAFQGHACLSVTVEANVGERELPAGTYLIESSQPLGTLAAYLLEPESDDGLATWNFFDPYVRENESFPTLRVLEPFAEGQLEMVTVVPPGEQLSLDSLMKPDRSISYGGGLIRGANWLKGSSDYVVAQGGRAFAVDAASGSMRPLDEMNQLKRKLAELDGFTAEQVEQVANIGAFTDDWSHALIPFKNDLYFFDAEANAARRLTNSPDDVEDMATLSPDASKVAFIRDNNLWIVDSATAEIQQLTSDGSVDLLNGILDWVYQEELYGRGNFKAFWWSPDSSRLAFLQLDQTPVPSYQVSDSISFGQSLEATRYPKAGEPLPTVRVLVADVATGKIIEVPLSSFSADDRLVGRVSWSPGGELWLQVYNRVQNRMDLVRVNAQSADGPTADAKIFLQESRPDGWLEIRGTPHFLPNGDFLWLSDIPHGRTHLFRVSASTGIAEPLTNGAWDVSELAAVSPDHSIAYVTGNYSSPIENHLLAVHIETGKLSQITAAPGSHSVRLDASCQFYIDVYSSLLSPPVASVHSIDGKLMRVIEAPTSDRHTAVDIRPPQLLTIPARDGLELQAMLMLPPSIDLDNPTNRLPVIFHVYGGPQAPTVRNAWQAGNYWFHQLLCQQGFAVVLCDNRASRGRGVADTWKIRGDMGRVELQDLEDAVQWVNQQPWADADRIGVWGWSYGGYFTGYALTHSKLFKAGISGAPVTDWRNYDAIYTERYMDLPDRNSAGYASSSVVEAADNLHGQLLIIHGERDDNVHMSNTLQLAYALQKAGKQFDLMIYPKNRHGITDGDQRYHMHRMMLDFWNRHLK